VQLPEALLKDVREHVARADREITDGYERQAVITYAATCWAAPACGPTARRC
jgi:hypothetical protein